MVNNIPEKTLVGQGNNAKCYLYKQKYEPQFAKTGENIIHSCCDSNANKKEIKEALKQPLIFTTFTNYYYYIYKLLSLLLIIISTIIIISELIVTGPLTRITFAIVAITTQSPRLVQ